MLAFDLAEKNKREAAIQYIKLLNQKKSRGYRTRR